MQHITFISIARYTTLTPNYFFLSLKVLQQIKQYRAVRNTG